MMKKLLVLLLFCVTLYGDSDETQSLPQEASLYLSYESLPEKIYQNQIFSIKVKILNTSQTAKELWKELGTFDGVKVMQTFPTTEQDGYTTFDTYYFQALKPRLRLPDLYYKLLREDDVEYEPKKLKGQYFNAVQLQSDKTFSHILAKDFKISSYKTTHYDTLHNIIVFSAKAEEANIADFNITQAVIQGFESYNYEFPQASMTYFAVIPKHLRKLEFSYFNLSTNSYVPVSIAIEVDEDTVSTQMDLAPTQYTHTYAKILIASVLILIGLVLFLIKRQKRYFFIIALTPILYVIWVYFPKTRLCIKPDAKIYLLPMENSTIFKKSHEKQQLQELGEVDSYHKVLLMNSNIGWIKNEDICEN